jgi:hypothetical protein
VISQRVATAAPRQAEMRRDVLEARMSGPRREEEGAGGIAAGAYPVPVRDRETLEP